MANNGLDDVLKRLQVLEREIQELKGRTFGTFAYYLLVIAAILVILQFGGEVISGFLHEGM